MLTALAEPILTRTYARARLYDRPCLLPARKQHARARVPYVLHLPVHLSPAGLVMDRKQDCSLKTPYICMLPGSH